MDGARVDITIHQNANLFVLRKYDGMAFKAAAVKPAHKELYVYGERDFFYHCDLSPTLT